jgi:protein AATF/BFR2
VQVLAKWSAKVQAVAPNVLLPANRGSFKNAFASKTAPPNVIEVIADTLCTDSDKLLARTRSSRRADDEKDDDVAKDAETFDDTDFYQQLLRDIIEARGAGHNGEEAEPEWLRRQKASRAKRKKTVDVKASKGRKLRYQVHEKLQNFMVPIAVQRGAWHDEQIDELFASILGSAGVA